MPTLPVDHDVAFTSWEPVAVVNAFARPLSQSMTAFGASTSGSAPTVTHPCESPVPGASDCTTAKPRGTHVVCRVCAFEIESRTGLNSTAGCEVRGGGAAPTS